jgi:hypothetical protein
MMFQTVQAISRTIRALPFSKTRRLAYGMK